MKAVNNELLLKAELKKYAALNEMSMDKVGRMLGWGNTTLYRKLGNTEMITLAELRRLAQMIGRDAVNELI